MALRKITAKAKQLLALAVFALILSSVAAAQGSESSITAQWTCPVAPELDIGTNYYAYLESSTDVQWFKWNLPSSGNFIAELEVPVGLDYDLEVYSSCSKKLCTSDNGASKKEECSVEAKAGWIYAKIYGYKGAFSKTKKYYIKGTFTASPKYDLAPAYILTIPTDPTDKDVFPIVYTIVNTGPDDITGKVTLKNYVDDSAETCTKEGLAFLEKFPCERKSVKLSSGWHKLKTIADPDNEVQETDENNNVDSKDLLVSHITDYDLKIASIWTSPGGELNDKKTFSVTAEVVNSGSDDITDSFKAYLSVDDNPSKSKTCTFSSLKKGTSAFCTLEDQKWTAGKHTVWASADKPGDSIAETDEKNNDRKEEFTVTHVPDADLIITNIYTIPQTLDNKTEFELRFEVKNAGSESALKPFVSKLYTNGQEKWACEQNSGAIADLTITCQLKSQKWQPGTYKLKAVADTANAIDETNEGNNELEKTIEVKQYCAIPDGTAADCECNFNTDCPSGYFCSLKEGYDPCKPLACKDECQQPGYFCGNGDAYECGNFDSDPCLDSKLKQRCDLYSQKCNTAKGSCDAAASPVKLRLEDAPSHSILVYKQPGDLVEVTITSDKLQDIDFTAPENFTLTYGICSAKTAAAPGETKCLFQISETTSTGKYQFAANEKTAAIMIIDKPKAVIITNKQKLNERFSNDKAGVKALLEQAFQYAHDEEKTVIYYLDREVEGHPFQSYGSYGESILSPEMTDNAYSMNTASLIASKCGDCASIIILGDDFVLPFYRADYAFIHNWWKWWAENKSETRYLYSDQPYIKEKKKTVGEIDSLFDRNEHKKVKIVVPDTVPSDIQGEIDKIKAAIKAFSYSDGDIKQLKSSEVGCNSYSALDEATLILIGTRDDNNAIKCVPWFDIGSKPTDTFKASIEIERNVWTNNEYAIILSGDVKSAITTLLDILKNPIHYDRNFMHQSSTIYVHEFSKPPELMTSDDYFQGFVLGKCEAIGETLGEQAPCIASDVTVSFTPGIGAVTDARDFALLCFAAIKEGGKTNWLLCAVSGGGTLTSIGTIVGASTVVGAAASESADVFLATTKGILKVLKSAMKASPGFEKIAKIVKVSDIENMRKFFNAGKKTDKEMLAEAQQRIAKLTSTSHKKFALNKLAELDESALKSGIKNVDDLENAAKGSERTLAFIKSGKLTDSGLIKLTDDDAVKTLGDAGKLKDVSGSTSRVEVIATSVNSNNIKGAAAELKRASHALDEGVSNLHVGKKLEVSGTSNGVAFNEMNVDVFYEKNGLKWAEEVKNRKQIELDDFVKDEVDQLDRYSQALKEGKINKITIIVDTSTEIIDEPKFLQELMNRGFNFKRVELPEAK